MPILNYLGEEQFDSDINSAVGEPIPGGNSYKIDRDIYEVKTIPGTSMKVTFLLHHRGQIITQQEYDYLLKAATDDPPVDPDA